MSESIWDVMKLGDVYDVRDGTHDSPKYQTEGHPLITSKNLGEDGLHFKKVKYISNKDYHKINVRSAVHKGDILFAMIGTIGNPIVVEIEPDFAIKNVALFKVPEYQNSYFLKYYLETEYVQSKMRREAKGTTQKFVGLGYLRKFTITLPPLPEQKCIVAILDEVFAGISLAVANAEKNLANARELFESYLNRVFTQKGEGWVEKKLSEVCSITSKLVDPRQAEYIDFLHIGAGNMKAVTGELVNVKTSREEGLISGKFVFEKTMVLYSKIRPYLMKACRPDITGLCSADVYPLVPNDELLNRDFLFHLLMSKKFTDYAIAGSGRAGMPKVNRGHLFRYLVFLPEVKQQKKIAKKLDELSEVIKHLETIYQKKLTALAELKQSILKKAFAGELTAGMPLAAAKTVGIETTSVEFSAKVIAFAYYQHAAKRKDKTYGRVKAQKVLHLIESIGGIDLGRNPIKDAAGPNDSHHMRMAEEWAKKNQFFEFVRRENDKGYDFKKLSRYDDMMVAALATVNPYSEQLEKVVGLLVGMKTREAEVFTTIHAAWNNLILNGVEITDETIIREARDNWHADKKKIPRVEFQENIHLIRSKGLIPDGTAKRVAGQEHMF